MTRPGNDHRASAHAHDAPPPTGSLLPLTHPHATRTSHARASTAPDRHNSSDSARGTPHTATPTAPSTIPKTGRRALEIGTPAATKASRQAHLTQVSSRPTTGQPTAARPHDGLRHQLAHSITKSATEQVTPASRQAERLQPEKRTRLTLPSLRRSCHNSMRSHEPHPSSLTHGQARPTGCDRNEPILARLSRRGARVRTGSNKATAAATWTHPPAIPATAAHCDCQEEINSHTSTRSRHATQQARRKAAPKSDISQAGKGGS